MNPIFIRFIFYFRLIPFYLKNYVTASYDDKPKLKESNLKFYTILFCGMPSYKARKLFCRHNGNSIGIDMSTLI